MARLLRESWWLLVAATFLYLALTLVTYTKTDRAWSTTGTGSVIANRGGVVGAWLSDLLLYLFGLSAWWWVVGGVVLVVLGYRRVVHPEREQEHPLVLAALGFALVLLSSASLEAIRLWRLPASLPLAPGGALGDALGEALARGIGFNGATLLLLAFFAVGTSLLFGISWLRVMERIGASVEALFLRVRARREAALDRQIGEQHAAERAEFVLQQREDLEQHEPLVVVPPVVAVPRSERVTREKQRPLFTEMPDSPLPPLSLLEEAPATTETVSAETLDFTSRLIERKLADFGVSVKVLAAYPGPVITRYEIEPAVGVKGAQIVNLVKDLARALSVVSIRVVETIPGKSCMALELPNPRRQVVKLVELLASTTYNDAPGMLTLALGKDIAGKPVVADLARMPHLLVAGTTGSGKSVAVNAMILSLLYKAEPRQVRLILIDPKMLELSVYDGIPHLLAPVVTDMKLAPNALSWCVGEMDRRYRLMSQLGVRNLAGYNQKVADAKKAGKPLTHPFSLTPDAPEPLEEMPLIVVVVDELADLMMVAGNEVEESICRLAQMARAVGIHLILATQRPSVDVITGLIKANLPARIAFRVSSRIDSRTVLDGNGAEQLLGKGDMLFLPPASSRYVRLHGPYISEQESARLASFLRKQGKPTYDETITADEKSTAEGIEMEKDDLYDEAARIVVSSGQASISYLQRRLRIGFSRAARLVDMMEMDGLVSGAAGGKPREVLVKKEYFDEVDAQLR